MTAVGTIGAIHSAGIGDDLLAVRLDGGTGAVVWRQVIDGGAGGTRDAGNAVAVDAAGDAFVAARIEVTAGDPFWPYGNVANFAVLKLQGSDGTELWRHRVEHTTESVGFFGGVYRSALRA